MKKDALKFMEDLVGPTTVGRLFRVYRFDADIGQLDLANRLNVTVGYISNLETGKKWISLEKLLEYCRKLNQNEKLWMIVYFEEQARRAGKKVHIKIEDEMPKKRA